MISWEGSIPGGLPDSETPAPALNVTDTIDPTVNDLLLDLKVLFTILNIFSVTDFRWTPRCFVLYDGSFQIGWHMSVKFNSIQINSINFISPRGAIRIAGI